MSDALLCDNPLCNMRDRCTACRAEIAARKRYRGSHACPDCSKCDECGLICHVGKPHYHAPTCSKGGF